MVNVGEICRAKGSKKLFADWRRLASVKALVSRKSVETGLPAAELIKVVKGGNPDKQGSWIHECLVDDFTRWLDASSPTGFTRDELVFSEMLDATFNGILSFEKQFPVDGYRIDFYEASLRIAVEFDESHHSKHQESDEIRQKKIEGALGCTFIRVKQGKEAEGINAILRLLLK